MYSLAHDPWATSIDRRKRLCYESVWKSMDCDIPTTQMMGIGCMGKMSIIAISDAVARQELMDLYPAELFSKPLSRHVTFCTVFELLWPRAGQYS
ncbi:hypothetical protein C5167_002583 [Papaver somniferum]|uniref:Uncharacterized protein n=1 Tax=Papaver somniferum TaxID=3469 RepID=A0A4Y7KZN9_PAPSO|nr:hypothetical protein C5167_002583 [Papaver somniferum]